MEKGLESERVLEELHQKYSKKRLGVNILLILILAVIVIAFFILLFTYFYSPEKTIGLGAEIEEVLIDEDSETTFIKLKAGSYQNLTKVKFTFLVDGETYTYETNEGISEISVPYKRSFSDWILGRHFSGNYSYDVDLKDIKGLDSFDDLEEVDVIFEYETDTNQIVQSPVLDTQRTLISHPSGGGGSPTPPPCSPSCTGKTCGSDGCGGSCGSCNLNQTCTNDNCVNITQCRTEIKQLKKIEIILVI
jgi:hypothetical protein